MGSSKKQKAFKQINHWSVLQSILTDTLLKSRLVPKALFAIAGLFVAQNVQAAERADGVQARLIVNVAVGVARIALVDILARIRAGVFRVAISTSEMF